MKKNRKHLLLALFMIMSILSFAQENFKWDTIIDSLDGNKDELYSKTKLFIAENWKSAQNVIQNEDKEAGIILIKGLSIQYMFFQLWDHKWNFSYSVKFLTKDNKCRIVIENVYCESARCSVHEWPHLPVADTYPTEKGLKTTGLSQERYIELMTLLKQDLQSIVDLYTISVKNPIIKNADW